MLQELGYQFDIIDSASNFNTYKLLILPDTIEYSELLENKLKDYLNSGGSIVGSYKSMIDEKKKYQTLYGVECKGKSKFDRDFVIPNDKIGKNLSPESYVMYLKGMDIMPQDAETLMETLEPYFNREGEKFCSHQHAPASNTIGNPAVVKKDQTIYFSHPIFTIYRKNAALWCKSMIKDALELLIPNKYIRHEGPSTLMVNLFHQQENNRYTLHLLHYITEKRSKDIFTIEDVIPLYHQKIQLYITEKKINQIMCIPDQQILDFSQNGDKIEFEVPEINGYQGIVILYE